MNQSIEMLGKLMDITALRQRVLANNLANASTPGFVRKDVLFSDAMAHAINRGKSVESVQPNVTEDHSGRVNEHGNNVSLQKELGEMTQNKLLYNFAAEMTGLKFSGLRKAISGTQ